MASRIKALQAQVPRIEFVRTIQREELVEYIAMHTGLNEGEILRVLYELRDAICFFLNDGCGVKLEGLGTYLPNIQLDGTFDVQYRLDRGLKRTLNRPNAFSGKIRNRKNIGKTPDTLIAQWNAEHPDDPVR